MSLSDRRPSSAKTSKAAARATAAAAGSSAAGASIATSSRLMTPGRASAIMIVVGGSSPLERRHLRHNLPDFRGLHHHSRHAAVELLDRDVLPIPEPDAIPTQEYERLISQFPTPHELRRYVQARVGTVVRQYTEPAVDAEALLNAYVDKRTTAIAPDLEAPFRQFDVAKYASALQRLQAMLANEAGASEAQWQLEIVEIILANADRVRAVSFGRGPDAVPAARASRSFWACFAASSARSSFTVLRAYPNLARSAPNPM